MRAITVAAVALAITACGSASPEADKTARAASRAQVVAAMDRYMTASRAVDADALAAFFTPTGVLFEPGIEPVVTREAIRRFMRSFPGVRVESADVKVEQIEIFGNVALYWGEYHERIAFPGQPVSEQRGRVVFEWVRQDDGTWLIQRQFRVPVATVTNP